MGEWSFRKLLAGLAALRPRDSSLQLELQPQLAADGFNVGLCLLKAGSLPFKLDHPSAILNLPALVSRMPPKTSSIKPSSISRALCSDGMRCIKPLAPSRNETNSSWVNGCSDGPFSQYAPTAGWIKLDSAATAKAPVGDGFWRDQVVGNSLSVPLSKCFSALRASARWPTSSPESL